MDKAPSGDESEDEGDKMKHEHNKPNGMEESFYQRKASLPNRDIPGGGTRVADRVPQERRLSGGLYRMRDAGHDNGGGV